MSVKDVSKVVGILISSSQPYGPAIGQHRRTPKAIRRAAFNAWLEVESGHGYSLDCLEAAYRMIEASPSLRREWFGAK